MDWWLAYLGLLIAALGTVVSVLLRLPRRWVDREVFTRDGEHRADTAVSTLPAARRRASWIADGCTVFGFILAAAAWAAG